jgi:hypothetical protein
MRTIRYLSVAALASLAACASDTTSPTVDVNALVNESATTAYSGAAFTASVGGARVPTAPMGTSTCGYSSANQRFECEPVTANGVTITRSYALLDANGTPLSALNPAAVASIHTITDMKGTMTTTGPAFNGGAGTVTMTMTIDRHEDATLSQLQAATHLLNATSTQKTDIAMTGLTISTSETSTTSNLQLPKPTADVHWPLGGTITIDQTMTASDQLAIPPAHEVISFNGTSTMTLTRTQGGLTTTCKIDLSKPGFSMCL